MGHNSSSADHNPPLASFPKSTDQLLGSTSTTSTTLSLPTSTMGLTTSSVGVTNHQPSNLMSTILSAQPIFNRKIGSVVVYIGMIPSYLEDDLLKACLQECGKVYEWIRPMDRLGKKLRPFGFCIFEDGVGALRCTRVLGNISFRMSYIAVKVGTVQQGKLNEVFEYEARQFLNGTEGAVDPEEKDLDVKKRIEALVSGERSINETYGIVENKKEKKKRKVIKKTAESEKSKVQQDREEGEESDDNDEKSEESVYEEYTDSDNEENKVTPGNGVSNLFDANAQAVEMFFATSATGEMAVVPMSEGNEDSSVFDVSPEEREMLKNLAEFRKIQAERERFVVSTRQNTMKKRIRDEMLRMDYEQRRAIEMAPRIAEEEARRAKRAEERQQREEMERLKNAAPVKVEMKGIGLGAKKKTAQAMFKSDADDAKPMRTLIPIDFTEEELKGTTPVVVASSAALVLVASAAPTVKKIQRSEREIASLIPKDKDQLNQFKLDWVAIKTSKAIENVAKAWVGKKIEEFLGESEETLCDFILSKITAGFAPSELQGELEVVLDSDAESFVLELYQILITESLKIS